MAVMDKVMGLGLSGQALFCYFEGLPPTLTMPHHIVRVSMLLTIFDPFPSLG